MADDARAGAFRIVGADEEFTPDTADSYPVPQPVRAVLPSGAKVLLERPNLLTLLNLGEIPNPLIGAVQSYFTEEDERELAARAEANGVSIEEQRAKEVLDKAAEEGEPEPGGEGSELDFIDVLCVASFLEPQLTYDPPRGRGERYAANGMLSVRALPPEDRLAVLSWAQGALAGMVTFREERPHPDPGGDGGTVRDEAERPARDPEDADEPVD